MFAGQMARKGGAGRPLVIGGILLGAGLGGFVDGILLHQILQWHQMFTSHPDPGIANDQSFNVTADGLFHAATWSLTLAGMLVVLRAFRRDDVPRSPRLVGGAALVGWGLFNLVEGVVDHHLLGIHHVHPSGALVWDLGFLVFGALLVVAGWLLMRSGAADPVHRRGPKVDATARLS